MWVCVSEAVNLQCCVALEPNHFSKLTVCRGASKAAAAGPGRTGHEVWRDRSLLPRDRSLTLGQARRRIHSHREEAGLGSGGEGEAREKGVQQLQQGGPALYSTPPRPIQFEDGKVSANN